MSTAEKEAQLRQLLGDPDLVKSVLGGASAAQKQADDLGIAFKETDLAKLAQYPDKLLDFAIKNFEAAQAKAAKEEEEEEEEKPAPDTAVKGMDAYMKKMDAYIEKMDGYMSKMGGEAKKEADPVTADANAATKAAQALAVSRIDTLETAVKELTDKLQNTLAELQTARKEAGDSPEPKAFANGNRPTQDPSTVKAGAQANVETKEAPVPDAQQTEKSFEDNLNGFFNFLLPHQQ